MLAAIHRLITAPIHFVQKKLSARHFLIFSSIVVGIASGIAAIALKYVVHAVETFVRYSSDNFENILIFACFPLIGILLTVVFQRYILKEPPRKGSAEIVYAIIRNSSKIPVRETYSHLLTSGLTVGFGGSVGLESPMVSTGAAIGANYGESQGLSYKERTVLLACGAAAGIAAAFNAPIAGVLFAVEVLIADLTAAGFIPLIIASATGALISKIALKEGVILTFSLQQPFNYNNVPFYILLGLIAGIVSLAYSGIFRGIEERVASVKNRWVRVFAGGIVLFVLIILFPPLYGEGYTTIRQLASLNAWTLTGGSVLRDHIGTETALLMFLAAMVFLKMISAAMTLGSGGNGGSFAPSLFVGAYLGFVFSRCINLAGFGIPESNFTIVAMAGVLSGVFYAPLTGIFLIAELTGGYELMIPLMIVSSLSLFVAHLFDPLSSEGRKLSRRLNAGIESRDKLLLSRIDLASLIETNFAAVAPEDTLGRLVRVIGSSSRNLFPVVGADGKLLGIVHLDMIRALIFDATVYDKLLVKDLMKPPAEVISSGESLHDALEKFDRAGQWNLPVIDGERYVGFLSKSSILTSYRHELVQSG